MIDEQEDAISRLMLAERITFVEAVERLAAFLTLRFGGASLRAIVAAVINDAKPIYLNRYRGVFYLNVDRDGVEACYPETEIEGWTLEQCLAAEMDDGFIKPLDIDYPMLSILSRPGSELKMTLSRDGLWFIALPPAASVDGNSSIN